MKKTSKKQNTRDQLEQKKQIAIIANPLRQGAPGIPNNAYGCLFENSINYSYGLLDRSLVTQKQGKIDCIKYAVIDGKKRRIKIEIKQGASPLATLNANGDVISSPLLDSDFVCYHPRFIPDGDNFIKTAIEECVFFTRDEFLDILHQFNGIRLKRCEQQANYKAGLPWYYDRKTIQSFYNKRSLTKFNRFCEVLYFEGMDYYTFCETYQLTNYGNI